MSEYFFDRACPPYAWRREDTPYALAEMRYQAAVIYRGTKVIGIQTERRHTFRRNLRCWLLRRWRDWQRPVVHSYPQIQE